MVPRVKMAQPCRAGAGSPPARMCGCRRQAHAPCARMHNAAATLPWTWQASMHWCALHLASMLCLHMHAHPVCMLYGSILARHKSPADPVLAPGGGGALPVRSGPPLSTTAPPFSTCKRPCGAPRGAGRQAPPPVPQLVLQRWPAWALPPAAAAAFPAAVQRWVHGLHCRTSRRRSMQRRHGWRCVRPLLPPSAPAATAYWPCCCRHP